MDGETPLRTKAEIEMIRNFNFNPTYFFSAQGPMFLAEKEEEKEEHKETKESQLVLCMRIKVI